MDKKTGHFRQNDENEFFHKNILNMRAHDPIITASQVPEACDAEGPAPFFGQHPETDSGCGPEERGLTEGGYAEGGYAMEASMMLWENSVLACLTGISAVTDMVQGKVYNAVTVPAFLT